MSGTSRSMTRALSAAVLVAGSTTAVTALGSAPSYADSVSVTDAVGDPVRIDDQDDDGELETTRVRGRALDIESTAVVYRNHVLVVRVRSVDSSYEVSPRVRVRAGGTDHEFSVDDRGRVYDASRGGGRPCSEARAVWDGPRDVHRIYIPSRCFGAPDDVRVGARLERVGDTTPSSVTLDDAVKGGGGRLYYRIGLGPRVARG